VVQETIRKQPLAKLPPQKRSDNKPADHCYLNIFRSFASKRVTSDVNSQIVTFSQVLEYISHYFLKSLDPGEKATKEAALAEKRKRRMNPAWLQMDPPVKLNGWDNYRRSNLCRVTSCTQNHLRRYGPNNICHINQFEQ